MRVYLNIGSNIGDRQGFIDAAIEAIEREFCCHALRSDVVESEPWGFASSNRFLNIGIALSIADCEPHELLRRLKAIESGIDSRSHRTADGGYADRAIDIDIIDIDGISIDDAILTIPHRHLQEREFSLVPYRQLKAMERSY